MCSSPGEIVCGSSSCWRIPRHRTPNCGQPPGGLVWLVEGSLLPHRRLKRAPETLRTRTRRPWIAHLYRDVQLATFTMDEVVKDFFSSRERRLDNWNLDGNDLSFTSLSPVHHVEAAAALNISWSPSATYPQPHDGSRRMRVYTVPLSPRRDDTRNRLAS